MKFTSILLIVVGVLFLFQTWILMALFLAESRKNIDPSNLANVELSIVENRTGQMVTSVVGSLIGCFGSWLLLLYLKIRRLEHQMRGVGVQQPFRESSGDTLLIIDKNS